MDAVENIESAWDLLFGYLLGNHAAWIVDIGLRAGLFAAIDAAGESISDDELARRMQLDPARTAIWCRAAFAYGVLDWDGRGYRLGPHMRTLLLDPGHPRYLGGRIQFYTALHEDFRVFPELLRSGDVWPRSAHDPWLLTALANLSRPDVEMLIGHAIPGAPSAEAALRAGGALLDIGSGLGHHLVRYATAYPTATIVGLEPDGPSFEGARRTLDAAGLDGRVRIRNVSGSDLEDAGAFDLVVMNITLHETGDEVAWRDVLARSHRALRPGGSIVVSELPYPDDVAAYRSAPVYRMLAGVQLHESVVGCGAITQGHLLDLVTGAGFSDVRVADQPMPTRHVVIGDR